MKCPYCNKKLKLINSDQLGEFICDNEDCLGVINYQKQHGSAGYPEFYGVTRNEIILNSGLKCRNCQHYNRHQYAGTVCEHCQNREKFKLNPESL